MPKPTSYREWQEQKIAKMHSDMLGKESVAYGPATGAEMCSGCRWFNEPWQGETHGYCQIVSGEILGSDTCSRYETIEAQAVSPDAPITPAPAETITPETPTEANKKGRGFQDTILTRKSKLRKMLPKEYRTNYAFEWMLPHDIEADEFYLIKGVAATEGEFKSGDIFTKENLAFGAGGMSTAAMQGIGIIDIDHYHEELPERYAKYGLEGINGEIGFLIDAGISINKVTDGDGKTRELTQVEWVGYTTIKKVAELVDEGKFIGTSVEDWSRSADCATDENGFPTECAIEGSHFINLGLILDEVPDSHGTWVNRVTSDDLETWKRNAEKNEPQFIIMKAEAHKLKGRARKIWAKLNRDARRKTLYDLTDYLDVNGNFENGKDGIFEYLTKDVALDEVTAKNISDYLWDHPSERNSWQMEMMSAGDWVAWYGHIQVLDKDAEIANLRKVLKKHGIKCMTCGNESKSRKIVRVLKTHVAKNEDGSCPEGTSEDPDDSTQCIETSVHIAKNEDGSCPDGYSPNPDGDDCILTESRVTKVDGACPEGTIEDPDNTEECIMIQTRIEKPESGCPVGWADDPDDPNSCIEITDGEVYEVIDMPEDGCPEGFRPINDDTQCTDEPEDPDTETPIVDMGRLIKHLKKKHNVTKEMEVTLRGLFKPNTLKKKTRSLRTVLSVESPIDKFAKSNHLEEELKPIDIDKELVKVAQIINFNRPGKHQMSQIIFNYRNALKTLKQLQKKEEQDSSTIL